METGGCPWAVLLTAPPGAPLRMRHRGRSLLAERPEQACKEKPPVALCIIPVGSPLQTQAHSRPTTSFGEMTATLAGNLTAPRFLNCLALTRTTLRVAFTEHAPKPPNRAVSSRSVGNAKIRNAPQEPVPTFVRL